MRTRMLFACALSAVLASCGGSGSEGPAGPPGEAGAPGKTGPAGGVTDAGIAKLIGTISGIVTGVTDGAPLDKVTVMAGPGNVLDGGLDGGGDEFSTTTATNGTFSFTKLPVGAYTLTFTRTGYVTMSLPGIGVTVGGKTNVAVALATDKTAVDGLAVTVSSNYAAGYDSPVALTAKGSSTDPNAGTLSYSWAQTGGVPATTLTGAGTDKIGFTTLTLASAKLEANPGAVLGPYDGGGFVPARFGPMGIGIDETGNYGFTVTLSDAVGHSVTANATVWATALTAGLRSVPLGVPVWFEGDSVQADGGAPLTTWSWTFVAPTGSKATLSSTTAQFVSFTPDVKGTYTLAESVGGEAAVNIYVSDWDGVMGIPGSPGTGNDFQVQGCQAGLCHVGPTLFPWPGVDKAQPPNMFTPYMATNMATAFERKLDGVVAAGEFGPNCLQCHTLGYDPAKTTANGGFDDIATSDKWVFPTVDAGDYANLVATLPGLAQVSGIQCENCHGPKNINIMGVDDTAAKTFSVAPCAPCHNDAPMHDEVGMWKTSLHANLQVAINEGSSSNCGRCHAAQGFAMYTQELLAGCQAAGINNCLLTSDGNPPADGGTNTADAAALAYAGLTASAAEPQTCTACHDNHGVAGNKDLLRVYDHLPDGGALMNGVVPTGVGAGLICMVCHNSRPSFAEIDTQSVVKNGLTLHTSVVTPHNGTQTDVLYGVNAYFVPQSTPSPHLAVTDACVGCHSEIPTAAQKAAGYSENHSFITDTSICVSCHGTGSNLVDGTALQGAISTQLGNLDKAIFGAYTTLLNGAITASASYNTTFRDPTTYASPGGPYTLCTGTGTTAVIYEPVTVVPTTYAPFAETAGPPVHTAPWRNLGTALVTLPTNTVIVSGMPECTIPSGATTGTVVAGVTYAGGPVVMSVSGVQAGPTHTTGGAATPLISAISITGQSIYNEALLNNDLSLGIHNLPFYQAVIGNTMEQLLSVTTTNP